MLVKFKIILDINSEVLFTIYHIRFVLLPSLSSIWLSKFGLSLPMCKILHLSTLKNISHLMVHWHNLSISFWIISKSSIYLLLLVTHPHKQVQTQKTICPFQKISCLKDDFTHAPSFEPPTPWSNSKGKIFWVRQDSHPELLCDSPPL